MATKVLEIFADIKVNSKESKKLNSRRCNKTPKDPTIENTKKPAEIIPLVKFSTICPIRENTVDRFNLLSPPDLCRKLICLSETISSGCIIIKSSNILKPSLYRADLEFKIKCRFIKKNPDKGSESFDFKKKLQHCIPKLLNLFLVALKPAE